jgi:hypothetical protein
VLKDKGPGFMTFVFGSFLGLKAGLGILGLGFFIFCVVWVWGRMWE